MPGDDPTMLTIAVVVAFVLIGAVVLVGWLGTLSGPRRPDSVLLGGDARDVDLYLPTNSGGPSNDAGGASGSDT
jgi:hypothetical protein